MGRGEGESLRILLTPSFLFFLFKEKKKNLVLIFFNFYFIRYFSLEKRNQEEKKKTKVVEIFFSSTSNFPSFSEGFSSFSRAQTPSLERKPRWGFSSFIRSLYHLHRRSFFLFISYVFYRRQTITK